MKSAKTSLLTRSEREKKENILSESTFGHVKIISGFELMIKRVFCDGESKNVFGCT